MVRKVLRFDCLYWMPVIPAIPLNVFTSSSTHSGIRFVAGTSRHAQSTMEDTITQSQPQQPCAIIKHYSGGSLLILTQKMSPHGLRFMAGSYSLRET